MAVVQLQVLSEQDIQSIHEATLEIMADTGFHFWETESALEVFRQNGCRVEGNRVFIPQDVTRECLRRLPSRETIRYFPLHLSKRQVTVNKGETYLSLIGNIYYTHDFPTDTVREATNEDAEDKDDLLNSLESFDFNMSNVFVLPGHEHKTEPFYDNMDDLPSVEAFLDSRLTRRGRLTKEWLPHSLMRPAAYVRLELLSYAIGEGFDKLADRLAKSHPFVWVNPISPLQYHRDQTMATMAAAASGRGMIQISPEPMMGSTSPVTLAGTLVQHNAEVLGMTVLAQLVHAGTACVYGQVGTVMDLRNVEISHGNFETQLLHVASVQMADYYGMPSRISVANTSARWPGPRAAAETAMGLYMGMAAGANIITTGLLNSTLTLSLEHLVLVDELFKQYKTQCQGFAVTEETLALDLVRAEGHPSPNFIANEHTFRHMRESVYYSDFNGRLPQSYEDWYQFAHSRVQEILANRHTIDASSNPERAERYRTVVGRLREDLGPLQQGEAGWWQFYCRP